MRIRFPLHHAALLRRNDRPPGGSGRASLAVLLDPSLDQLLQAPELGVGDVLAFELATSISRDPRYIL